MGPRRAGRLLLLGLCVTGIGAGSAQAANPTFAPKVDYAADTKAYSMAAGDFNHDGRSDLVAANVWGNNVSVYLGNGGGTFANQVKFTTGIGPVSVAIGDFNDDGNSDLVTANRHADTVTVRLGAGDGTFPDRADLATGSFPVAVAVGDLNRDGRADLAIAQANANKVRVLLGSGAGTFQGPSDYVTASTPVAVAIGDVDNDGTPDLAVANDGSASVSVLRGTGGGAFAARVDLAVGSGPSSVAIGDLDHDGNADLAVANQGSSSASVLRGGGDGTFATRVNFTTGAAPYHLAMADLDRDGRQDLVTANFNANTVSVLAGNGNGTFAAKTDHPTGSGPRAVAVGDLDRDGDPDLAVANETSATVSVLVNTTAHQPSWRFAPRVDHDLGDGAYAIAAGDLNHDGSIDSVATIGGASSLGVFLGSGTGTFGTRVDHPTGVAPFGVALGDLNHDGHLDAAVGNIFGDSVSVLLGNGDGTFAPQQEYPVGWKPGAVGISDLDADGDQDLVVANQNDNSVSVLLGAGDGTFPDRSDYGTGDQPLSVVVGDLNNDGRPDIATANRNDSTMSVLLGNGDGSFLDRADHGTGDSPESIAIGDVNRDGWPDLVTADTDGGTISVFIGNDNGNGDGAFAARAEYPAGTTPGAVVVTDFNGDGAEDLIVANVLESTVRVLLGDGSGAFADGVAHATGFLPSALAVADLESDGDTDLLVAHRGAFGPTIMSVLLNEPNLPGRPTGLAVWGATPANDNAPRIAGDAHAGFTVNLYTDDACTGPIAATGTAEAFASGLTVSVSDGSSTSFYATESDAYGNVSACSMSSVTYTEDSSTPSTTDDVPGYVNHDVTVTLTAADPGGSGVATTYYTTDGTEPTSGGGDGGPAVGRNGPARRFRGGGSPVYDPDDKPVLRHGERIRYFSVDVAGNAEAVRTSAAAQVDTQAPETTLQSVYVNGRVATVRFGGSDAEPSSGLTYRCRLDAEDYQPCTSPATFASVPVGEHAVDVKAVDGAGNEDATPVHHGFTVDGASTTGTVTDPAGGTVATRAGSAGPSASDPVLVEITIPTAGTVRVTETAPTDSPPAGFSFVGHQFDIEAPVATESAPLKLVFRLAAAELPTGTTADTITIYRNGSAAGACTGSGTATPDPCVAERQTLSDGTIVLTVLAIHASRWNVGVPAASSDPAGETPTATATATVAAATRPLVLSHLGVNHRCTRAGRKGVSFRFRLSHDAMVRYDILRRVDSPVWSFCPPTGGTVPITFRGLWHRISPETAGQHHSTVATASRRAGRRVAARRGRNTVSLARAAGSRRLRPGTYLLYITAVDAQGRPAAPVYVKFWVLSARKGTTPRSGSR